MSVKKPTMCRQIQGGAQDGQSDFKGKSSLPSDHLALPYITPPLPGCVSRDALLVFCITNLKAECLSGYLFTSGTALPLSLSFCFLSTSPSLPAPCHPCSTVK